jgi:hypothetical protein
MWALFNLFTGKGHVAQELLQALFSVGFFDGAMLIGSYDLALSAATQQ